MTFENLRPALIPGYELGHVAFPVTEPGKPFGAFRHCISLRLRF